MGQNKRKTFEQTPKSQTITNLTHCKTCRLHIRTIKTNLGSSKTHPKKVENQRCFWMKTSNLWNETKYLKIDNPISISNEDYETTMTSLSPSFVITSVDVQSVETGGSINDSDNNEWVTHLFKKYSVLFKQLKFRFQVPFHAVFGWDIYDVGPIVF